MIRRISLLALVGMEDLMLPCFTKKFIGVDCPGCGIQRSLVHLAKGEFSDALAMYPALLPLLLLFSFMLADQFYTIKHASKIISGLMILSVATILTNYILKFI
jgi:hypothetical protein